MSTKTVLVVGGSAAGIQLALEEAEKGNEVYLVEEVPLLRTTGIVADGDVLKTSQLLAELEKRSDKVHVIAPADLVRVAQGKNGQFKVKARKKATGVMPERCNSCEDCVLACPVIMEDPYRNRLPSRTAIDSLNPGCGGYHIVKEAPPCQEACPVHLDVRGYVGYIADGKYRKSLDLIREHLPFPGIIGRICTRPCENVRNRGMADESIAICALKRFVADRELEREAR